MDLSIVYKLHMHHQWRSGSALRAGRRRVRGSIPGRAWRHSRGFLRWLGSLRKISTEGTPPAGPGSPNGQKTLILQPTNQPHIRNSTNRS